MGIILPPPILEFYLCDQYGVRIELLDYLIDYDYCHITNDIAPFRLKLPAKFDRKKVRIDQMIEIWRGFEPGTLKLDYLGFLRDGLYGDEAGMPFTEIYGYCTKELLKRRVIKAYTVYAADHADDLIKAVAKDCIGSDAGAGRDLTSVGGGFTIQQDLHDGQSITKDVSYKNCLTACQEIADASARAGTNVYFDIIPDVSSAVTGNIAFQLRTFADQRGNDRTWDSSTPVFVGSEWGNLENAQMDFDCAEEINYVYVLGPGEGAARETTEISSPYPISNSIWGRREGSKDARRTLPGDTAARTGEGNTYLRENKPKFRFAGDIVETPYFRYKRDWDFGDHVTGVHIGLQKDALINKVFVSGNPSGETITAKLELTEW